MKLFYKLFLVCCFAFGVAEHSFAQLNNSQVHLRTGFFRSSFSGSSIEGDAHMSLTTINIEYELFRSSRISHAVRTVMAMDFGSAKLMYFNAGYGQRYYLGGPGMRFIRQEGNISVISVPKIKYYVGFNTGISQVIVRSLTPALQIVGSVLDFGLDSGVAYSLSPSTALSASLGASYGWGFSSVAVTGITLHMLLGANHSF